MRKIELNNNTLVEVCQLSQTHCITIAIFDSIHQAITFAKMVSREEKNNIDGNPWLDDIYGIFIMGNQNFLVVKRKLDAVILHKDQILDGTEEGGARSYEDQESSMMRDYADYLLGPLDPRD